MDEMNACEGVVRWVRGFVTAMEDGESGERFGILVW